MSTTTTLRADNGVVVVDATQVANTRSLQFCDYTRPSLWGDGLHLFFILRFPLFAVASQADLRSTNTPTHQSP